jgi:hypothetical protein
VNHHLGLVDVAGKPKPAYHAMRFLDELLNRPVRVLPAAVSKPSNSQAVVRLFVRDDGEIVLAAWLRSSEYQEVPRHTGTERDRRRERVSVTLPCSASGIATYNALGKRISATKKRPAAILAGLDLRGDRVTIVTGRCPAAP